MKLLKSAMGMTGQQKGVEEMARRKFAKLKNRMFEMEITQEEAAKAMGRSMTYLSSRLNCRGSFSFNDALTLGKLLGIPRTEWVDYFMDDRGETA